jgi:chlorophyll synthase
MLFAQWAVAILLLEWGSPNSALAVLLLSVCQLPLMLRFIQSPVEKALSVSAFGVPLFVSGMMVSAWALRALEGATF